MAVYLLGAGAKGMEHWDLEFDYYYLWLSFARDLYFLMVVRLDGPYLYWIYNQFVVLLVNVGL